MHYLKLEPRAAGNCARNTTFLVALAVLITAGAGCRSTNRLADYDFSERTLAVNTVFRGMPEVETGDFYFIDGERPLRSVLKLGSSLVKRAEAEKAQQRMDSAMQLVDVSEILYDRILHQSAIYLNAEPVGTIGQSDYLLDVNIREYGIDAKSWDANAFFKIKAHAQLVDRRAGRLIWETGFEEREPISPAILGPHPAIRNVLSANALANLSVDELAAALEQLADYAADRITRRLQHDLYESRD